MRLDQNPVHRKAIFPWYDSKAACYVGLVLMGMVLVFGIIGVRVSCETAEYNPYIWFPVCLTAMSAGVILSIIRRLIHRCLSR